MYINGTVVDLVIHILPQALHVDMKDKEECRSGGYRVLHYDCSTKRTSIYAWCETESYTHNISRLRRCRAIVLLVPIVREYGIDKGKNTLHLPQNFTGGLIVQNATTVQHVRKYLMRHAFDVQTIHWMDEYSVFSFFRWTFG